MKALIQTITFSLLLIASGHAFADDTEIFFSSEVSKVNPNVMFILDVSGSMDEEVEAAGTETVTSSLSRKIMAENDDAVETLDPEEITLLNDDLSFNNNTYVGLRFTDLDIPRGATITNATIQFRAKNNTKQNQGKIKIKAQNISNAPEFENAVKNISGRDMLSTTVYWWVKTWDQKVKNGETQAEANLTDSVTPNLKKLVQSLVDRPSWNPGNAAVFTLYETKNNRNRIAISYENDVDEAPELYIEYEWKKPKKSRLNVMQSALKTVLDNAPSNLNVGLMNYGEINSSDKKVGVKFPIKPIEEEAYPTIKETVENTVGTSKSYSSIPKPEPESIPVRSYLPQITNWYWKKNWYYYMSRGTTPNEMNHVGTTPIVEALYEAALYFRGDPVSWGFAEPNSNTDSGRAASHPSTYDGAMIKYDSNLCDSSSYKYVYTNPAVEGDFTCPLPGETTSDNPSFQNCKDGEYTKTYINCIKRAESTYVRTCVSRTEPDEAGKTICLKYETTGSTGQCLEYERKTYYRYRRCTGGYAQDPYYISPIAQSCQRNFIVLLSDGKPQYSSSWDSFGNRDGTNETGPTYQNLKSGAWSGLVDQTDDTKRFNHNNCASNLTPSGYASGACGPELTRFLADSDQSPLIGEQTVDTYAIGFGLGAEQSASDYLQSLVTTSDGYFTAEDEDKLSKAFSNILSKVGATTSSYASPGYTVNMNNTTENEDFIYIPVFDKKISPTWKGNLKKFKLVPSTDSQGRGVRKIQGKGNIDAVSELGELTKTAIDYWSNATEDNPDGYYVEKGGVASLLEPENRQLYSDLSCNSLPCPLYLTKNKISEQNTEDGEVIDNQLLEIDPERDELYRKKLIRFIQGYDSAGDSRNHIGDILHSAPLTLTYKKGDDNGTEKKQYIFTATNEGYLHAFDTTSGKELFAFMPKELFKNIETQYQNTEAGGHRYGIDGFLSIWHDDNNKDGEVNGSDKVTLYMGMRRGARSYYALDITNINEPTLQWKINSSQSDFSNLGFTWSKVYLSGILSDDTEQEGNKKVKKVAIFTGGYDNNRDPEATATQDIEANHGNDIFIVDAETGRRIWSLQSSSVSGASALKHSIPGGVRILDLNGNGAIDRMYFGDTAGNIWRLELNEMLDESDEESRSQLIKLASFGGSSTNARKFYNEPDVSLFKHNGKSVLAVSIGSGYRPHPMYKTINDHFFTLLDYETYNRIDLAPATTTFETATLDDMAKISISIADGTKNIDYGDLEDSDIITSGKRGWYVNFATVGEKVLADAITVDGTISFTTFVPVSESSNTEASIDLCAAPTTQGRLYSMNLLNAKPAYDLDWSGGDLTNNDIFTIVSSNEIPGSPQRVYNPFECTDGKCQHTVDIRVGKKLVQTSSYDRSFLEAVYWSNPTIESEEAE